MKQMETNASNVRTFRRKELMNLYDYSRTSTFTEALKAFGAWDEAKEKYGFDMDKKRIFPPKIVAIIFEKLGRIEK